MHALLDRQLRKRGLSEDTPPDAESWRWFLDHVGRAYTDADQGRDLLERSLALSSKEMGALYADLRRSEERFRSLVQNASDVIVVLAADGAIQYISASATRVFGHHPEDWLGRNAFELIHPEDRPAITEGFEHVLTRPGLRPPIEFRLLHADGAWRDVEATANNLLYDPSVGGVVETLRDITERRRAEAARRAAEARYQSIFENAIEGVFQTGSDGRMIAINPAGARVLGFDSPEEALARRVLAADLFVDDAERRAFLQRMRAEGAVRNFQCRSRRHNGDVIWVVINARAIPDLSGQIVGVEGFVTDVSARVEADREREQLRAEAERRAAEVEGLLTITAALNAAETEREMVRATVVGMAALCPSEHSSVGLIRGDTLHISRRRPNGSWVENEYVPARVGSIGQHVIRTRRAYLCNDLAADPLSDHDVVRRLGFRSYLSVPIIGSEGDVLGLLGLFNKLGGAPFVEHDQAVLTAVAAQVAVALERARSRQELARIAEARARLARIVESSDDAIISAALTGEIISWNGGAERMYGHGADAAIDRPLAALVTPDHPEELTELVEAVAAGQETETVEMTHVRSDGEPMTVSLTISAIRDMAGRVAGVSVIARNITEERRLAARLAQAEQLSAIGELAAGMAHEINNPLAAVSGTAELLLRRPLPADVREDLITIHREVGRAGDIVRALLRFARQREPSLEPLALGSVIKEALALRGERLARHEVAVFADQQPVPEVYVDQDQMLQAVLNLINNAIDAMKQSTDKRLWIRLAPAGDGVEIVVRDSGPGIPADVLSRIFHPFFTTKAPGEGTGLGLSISQRIVSDHGGTLTAENAPGGGALFRLTLPPAPARDAGPTPEGLGTVLILHDDLMAAEMLAEAVRLLDYTPIVVQPDEDLPASPLVAVFASPDVDGERIAALAAPGQTVRLIATSPPAAAMSDTPWESSLPRAYRLDDVRRALEGTAA